MNGWPRGCRAQRHAFRDATEEQMCHGEISEQGGRAACVDFFLSGGALLVPSSTTSLQRVRKLLDKYADLPMDFADATLVALAEELDCASVFTTDRADFSVYRIKGRKPFRILPSD
jgi:predicted nucleic acid-binding protein